MSHSNRISCTEGGGNATANPTIPKICACDFLLWVKLYCDLNRQRIKTTCKGFSSKKKDN